MILMENFLFLFSYFSFPWPMSITDIQRAGNILNFCNEALKLNGTLPLTVKPVLTYDNTSLTGITVTTNGQHTIAFLGTASGQLKKVKVFDNKFFIHLIKLSIFKWSQTYHLPFYT